jgi:hypothetical protein
METEFEAGVIELCDFALAEIPDLFKYCDDHVDKDDEKMVGQFRIPLSLPELRLILIIVRGIKEYIRRVQYVGSLPLVPLCFAVRRWPWWLPKPAYYYLVKEICNLVNM